MKAWKKLMAGVLTACLIMGLPLGFQASAASPFTLDRADVINDTQMFLYFSENVGFDAGAEFSIRIVDDATSQTVLYDGAVKLEWSGTVTKQIDHGSGNIRVIGSESTLATAPGNILMWTLNTTPPIIGNAVVDTIDEIIALTQTGGKFEGKTVMFCIEETTPASDNLVTGVFAVSDNTKLRATRTAAGQADGTYLPLTEAFRVRNAYYYNDTHFIVEFSEQFTKTSGYEMWVRIVNGNNVLQKNAANQNLQGKVVVSGTNAGYYGAQNTVYGNRLMGTLVNASSDGALKNHTYSQMKAIIDEHNAADPENPWYIRLCVREQGGTAGDMTMTNFVSSVYTRKLVANFPGKPGVDVDCSFIDMEPVTEKVSVTSAEVTGVNTLKVTFSEPISMSKYSATLPYIGIRVVNAGNALQKHNGTNMQWAGSLTATDDPCVYTFTITTTQLGLTGIADIKALADSYGFSVKLCFEQAAGGAAELTGYVDNVTSSDGIRILEVSAPSTNGHYAPITFGAAGGELTIVSAAAINDVQMRFTFNQPAQVTGNIWTGIRLVDAAQVPVSYDGAVMQWSGVWEWTDETQTEMLWTIRETTKGCATIPQLVAYIEENEIAGTLMAGVVEQTTSGVITVSNQNDKVDNVSAVTGLAQLNATCLVTGRNAGAYAPFTPLDFDPAPLTVNKVEQISQREMIVTFSDAVEISGLYSAIVMVDDDDNAIRVDGDGNVVADGGALVRWSGSWSWYDAAHTQIKWTLAEESFGCYNLAAVHAYAAGEAFSDYTLKFSLVEQAQGDTGIHYAPANGLVSSVRRAGENGGKFLDATKVETGQNDRTYNEITWNAFDAETIKLLRTDIHNDTQLILTFSAPVEIIGSPFSFIRLVNEANVVASADGEVLQWGGTLRPYGTDGTQIIFTLRGSQHHGVESLVDLFYYNGDMAPLKALGLTFKLCLAEQSSDALTVQPGNGYIDNFRGPDGAGALESTYYRAGTAEAVLCEISGGLPNAKLRFDKAVAIDDRHIILSFSAPIEITGSPYLAIRLVDADGNLVRDEELGYMQWSGTWAWNNDAHTEIIWTMNRRNKADISNITDLLNYTGLEKFKDYTWMFGIEEAGTDNEFGRMNKTIDNIGLASDPRIHLQATVMLGMDRLFAPIETEYKLTHITAAARVINDTQVRITFSEQVRIEGTPYLALRFVSGGSLMWSGNENVSYAMQFNGAWEWAGSSRTQIIWTMSGSNRYGANNIYDVLNYNNGLVMFNGAPVLMCIEEAGPEGVGGTGVLENISSLDGTRHLKATDQTGNDKRYMPLTVDMPSDEVYVRSVKAIDPMTLEITFSETVVFAEGALAPSLDIRYLTASGEPDTTLRGLPALFRGTWAWKDKDAGVMTWTLNTERSHGATSLTDIFNFEEDLYFNRQSNIAFCIQDPETQGVPKWTMRVLSVTNLDETARLRATKMSEYGVSQTPIEVLYELPAPSTWPAEETDGPGPDKIVREITDYTWVYIVSAAIVVAGGVVCLVLAARSRKKAR